METTKGNETLSLFMLDERRMRALVDGGEERAEISVFLLVLNVLQRRQKKMGDGGVFNEVESGAAAW